MIFIENRKLYEKKQKLTTLVEQLSNFPSGKIICAKNGKYYKWYYSNNKKLDYLPKSKRDFAEQLVLKKYLQCQIEDLSQEIKSIQLYEKALSKCTKTNQLMKQEPFSSILAKHFSLTDQWSSEPYVKNERHPETLIHKSFSGNILRSKSETIIDLALFINKIPYRYECELALDGTILYPDFTIKHPLTGEIFYWEHFGMMDSPNYIREFSRKLQIYADFGIIPTINLITTYETKDHPFSAEEAEQIVQKYFL